MSYKGYLTNVEAKTGKSPADFRRLAAERGFSDGNGMRAGVKASAVVDWLKAEFDHGHGHAMAVVTLLKGSRQEGDS